MSAANHWGIQLICEENDKQAWLAALKPPFDPYVESVLHEGESYLALRSTMFDGMSAAAEVYAASAPLIGQLNLSMGTNFDTDPISPGAVADFSFTPPRRQYFIKADASVRARAGVATFTTTDAKGNTVEAPVSPSSAQDWVRAASLHKGIAAAMRYLGGRPN